MVTIEIPAIGTPVRSVALHLNFLLSTSAPISAATIKGPTLTFTRASNAMVWNESGVLVQKSSNESRFDHDPAASNAALGLLIEMARTNNQLWSDDWTNAVYTATNITAAKDATGPDGAANSASTLTADANNGDIIQTITLGSAEYTTSVLMKRKTGTGTVEITDNDFTNATDITADINSSTWTQVGNITRTQANPVVGIRLGTSGDEVEVALGQCEAGAFMTSPIPTTTATVTRAQDVCTTTDMSWMTSTRTFTFIAEWEVRAGDTGLDAYMFSVLRDGNTSAVNLYDRNNHVFASWINNPTANDAIINGTTNLGTTAHKGAVASADDDAALYLDGSSEGTNSTVDEEDWTLVSLEIGRRVTNAAILNGHIQDLKYWPIRKTNAELATETT